MTGLGSKRVLENPVQHFKSLCAVDPLQQPEGKQQTDEVGEQHLAGVGPEADDTGNGPLRTICDCFGDDVAMAGVQPVKASQGQRGGLAGIRR